MRSISLLLCRRGIANTHAYSILRAVEEVGEDDKKVRLVLVRYVVDFRLGCMANSFEETLGEDGLGTAQENGRVLGPMDRRSGRHIGWPS